MKKTTPYTPKSGTSSNYALGIKAENKVASQYKNNGWNVMQSPGSRGAADLKCSKNNITHYVQVKSSTTNTPSISNYEAGRLKSTSTRNGATAVIAKVTPTETKIMYAKNNQSAKLK
jgi:Holliday junction resolvase